MKRKQINAIFVDEVKRKKTIIAYITTAIIVLLVSILFLVVYLNLNKEHYVSYTEKSDTNYKVYLNDNDFFSDIYLTQNKQYISTLINYISANFDYELSLDEKNVDYKYSYRVESDVKVLDKETKNVLYEFKEDLVPEKINNSSQDMVKIIKTVDVDYNKYNLLIKKFVDVYSLDNAISTLNVNMYVDVIGSCEEFKNDESNESVITISIPLTTNTMAIDITNDFVAGKDNVVVCKKSSALIVIYLIISIIGFFITGYIVYKTIKYDIKTRSAEDIYERELKKILRNYGSYIQKINNVFNLRGYQKLDVDTFTDMLEVRDTVQQPILMVESADRKGTYFIIPSNTKLLYVYSIKVSDIKKQIYENTKNN